MSEQHEEFRDGPSPEDRLIRYKWALTDEDAQAGEERAEAIYATALLALGAVLEAHGIGDAHERNIILGRLVPGPFNIQGEGAKFKDWLIELQLLPMQLLDKELPPIESYSERYLTEAFATALPEGSEHGGDCMNSELEGSACDKAATCPARVTSEIGLRQLGILVFDLHTYERSQDMTDVRHIEGSIDHLSYRLKHYGLVNERALGVIMGEMNKVANDFFTAILRPNHRKPD